jgi:nickel/cobalt exporter
MDVVYSDAGLLALLTAAFVLAVSHTISPDHWFPFVMVGRARKWGAPRILALAALAGIGHVGTSVAIGLISVLAEKGSSKTIAMFLESATPVLLMVFGFGYALYAVHRYRVGRHRHAHGIPLIKAWLGIEPHAHEGRNRQHPHPADGAAQRGWRFGRANLYLHNMEIHVRINHDDHGHLHESKEDEDHMHEHAHTEVVHNHAHQHAAGIHAHTHEGGEHQDTDPDRGSERASWGLVAILGLTPCIALLPLTFAAAKYGIMAVLLVNAVFSAATVATILVFTWLGTMGLSCIRLDFFDDYGDVFAGVIIGLLGLITQVFAL